MKNFLIWVLDLILTPFVWLINAGIFIINASFVIIIMLVPIFVFMFLVEQLLKWL